jgi:acylphosphatase
MAGDVVRAHVVVRGHVQRVYFRQSTAREASAHGVAGWVRNLPDGSVEAVFEGSADAVESALGYARTGPARAEVTSCDVSWEPPEGEAGFRVRD